MQATLREQIITRTITSIILSTGHKSWLAVPIILRLSEFSRYACDQGADPNNPSLAPPTPTVVGAVAIGVSCHVAGVSLTRKFLILSEEGDKE